MLLPNCNSNCNPQEDKPGHIKRIISISILGRSLEIEEVFYFHIEGVGNLQDIDQGDVLFAPLDHADVGPVHAYDFGKQRFLGIASLRALSLTRLPNASRIASLGTFSEDIPEV